MLLHLSLTEYNINMEKIKILIACYLYFPANTPRAFRCYELSQELARQGHDVTVMALIGDHDYSDIETETLHIKNIGSSRFGNADVDGNWNKNIIYRVISRFVGSRWEFPTFELMGLVSNSVGDLHDYEMVISVAWPYPIHWGIGKLIQDIPKKQRPVWISDCGDPYMGNPMSKKAFIFKRVEKWWGRLTDFITIPIESARKAYYPEVQDKIRIIPQGFNYDVIQLENYQPNPKTTFIFAGKIYPITRDPSNFIEYLSSLDKDFEFHIYTDYPKFFDKFKDLIGNKLFIHNYIPRLEIIKKLSKADFIVNIQNVGSVQAPSKLIDYSLAKRPILNISSEFNEHEVVDEFMQGNYQHRMEEVNIDQFNIKNVAMRFLDLYSEKRC